MLTGEFSGIKVLATVTVAVAMVLAALAVYLCMNRNRQSWNDKGDYKILHYKHAFLNKNEIIIRKYIKFYLYTINTLY